MPFTLFVAADLYSQKVNVEIELPSFPTVNELLNVAQSVFNNEASVLKPPTMELQTVGVEKLQVYKDDDGSWSDLVSPSQIVEFAQLYVIQKHAQYQESQQQIPPARKPSRPIKTASSPPPPARPAVPVSPYTSAAAASPYSQARHVSPPRRGSPPRTSSAVRPTATYASSSPQTVRPQGPASPERDRLAIRPLPEGASQRDKISYVFDEMDVNGNRVIEPEEFRNLLNVLGVGFSAATLSDLFHKSDLDRDGVASLGEMTTFLSNYPTLLDALYFRLRDIQEGRKLQDALAEERRALDAARAQRGDAANAVTDAVRLVHEAQAMCARSDAEREQRMQREAEMRHMLAQCEQELDIAGRHRNAAQSDVDSCRDREASHQVALSSAQREAQDADGRLAGEQNQLRNCQDKERELQALLAEARKDTERQHHTVVAAQADLGRLREKEQSAALHLADVQRTLAAMNDRLVAAEREAQVKNERAHEMRALLDEASVDVQRVVARLDQERRDAQLASEREQSNRLLLNEAESNVQLTERRLVSRDNDIVAHNQRRAAMEQQERPLLEQEVRLREQRDHLDQKETTLRRESDSYFDGHRTAVVAPPSSASVYASPSSQHGHRNVSPRRSSPYRVR